MDIVNQCDAVAFITADGSTIRELLAHRNSSIRNQSLAEARLAPGMATTPHHHKVTEEIYYILSGEAEMTLATKLNESVQGMRLQFLREIATPFVLSETWSLSFFAVAPGYESTDTFLEHETPIAPD